MVQAYIAPISAGRFLNMGAMLGWDTASTALFGQMLVRYLTHWA